MPSLGDGRRIDLAVPGVLALCVISASFTAQAIATGFDRRYAVLRLLGTTPLGRDGLLWGCLLYTSDAADERSSVDLGGRRIIKQKKKELTALQQLDCH